MKKIISHSESKHVLCLSEYEKRILGLAKPYLPISEELALLKQLNEFPLGRFLLNNQGLNGYWTDYIVFKAYDEKISHPLEDFLINKCPGFKATQERFRLFQNQIQGYAQSNDNILSIPCGLMSDLLTLEHDERSLMNLYGIDLDNDSLEYIKEKRQLHSKLFLIQGDAWNLDYKNYFKIITSNGLNIYEKNQEKLISLYKGFHKALKKDGILITSFLTPPPSVDSKSPWKNFNEKDLILQRAIFEDILGVKWTNYETVDSIMQKMTVVGFKLDKIQYDSQNMFPTITLKKN